MADADESDSSGTDFLKEANLLPLKHATSIVWIFFGFKNEDGVIKDHSHVSMHRWQSGSVALAGPALIIMKHLSFVSDTRPYKLVYVTPFNLHYRSSAQFMDVRPC